MGSPRPPNWSFAARAAYFGDQLCPFCDHRNPAGAKFCNDCASPLHLKPCRHCDAVNHASATACYKCGATHPAPLKPESALPWRAFEPEPSAVAATLTDLKMSSTPPSHWPSITAGQLVLAVIVTVLIASAYSVYRTGASPPLAMPVVSQPTNTGEYDALTAKAGTAVTAQPQLADVRENDAATAAPVPPVLVESNLVEAERVIVADPTSVAGNTAATNRALAAASALPATKQTTAHRRPADERRGHAGTAGAHNLASAHAGTPAAEGRNPFRASPADMMNVSLARCSGDIIARIVCEQRVRQRFCEGRWDATPECLTGVTNEHRR
jgi:ribosomal protein L40E